MLNRNIKFWVCLECKIHYVQEYLYLKSGVYYQHSIFFPQHDLCGFKNGKKPFFPTDNLYVVQLQREEERTWQ